MDLKAFKNNLVEQIIYQADWRENRAAEYPSDYYRNHRSAEALRFLATRVDALPPEHSKLRELWRLWYGLRKPGEANPSDDALPFVEAERDALRRYGFHTPESGDAEDFLERYACLLKKEIEMLKG